MKKKPNNFVVHLVSFPYDIMFSFGQTDKELKKDLKRVGSEFDELLIFGDKNTRGKCVMNEKNQTVVRMPKFPKNCSDYGTLQHEIFHAVSFILDRIGIKLDVQTSDECYAYLIGYITTEVYKLV